MTQDAKTGRLQLARAATAAATLSSSASNS